MGRVEIATRREGGGRAVGEELQIKPNGTRDENGGRSPPYPVPFGSPHFLLSFGVWRFGEQKHSRTRKKKNACRQCRLPKPTAIFTVFLAVLVAVS